MVFLVDAMRGARFRRKFTQHQHQHRRHSVESRAGPNKRCATIVQPLENSVLYKWKTQQT